MESCIFVELGAGFFWFGVGVGIAVEIVWMCFVCALEGCGVARSEVNEFEELDCCRGGMSRTKRCLGSFMYLCHGIPISVPTEFHVCHGIFLLRLAILIYLV